MRRQTRRGAGHSRVSSLVEQVQSPVWKAQLWCILPRLGPMRSLAGRSTLLLLRCPAQRHWASGQCLAGGPLYNRMAHHCLSQSARVYRAQPVARVFTAESTSMKATLAADGQRMYSIRGNFPLRRTVNYAPHLPRPSNNRCFPRLPCAQPSYPLQAQNGCNKQNGERLVIKNRR